MFVAGAGAHRTYGYSVFRQLLGHVGVGTVFKNEIYVTSKINAFASG